jgi:hypothetical protein
MLKGSNKVIGMLAGAAGAVFFFGCMNPTDSPNSGTDQTVALRSDADSAGTANGKDHGKTTICHMPPGNPANAHTLSIGDAAVPAHLAHGDKLGRCEDLKPQKPCPDKEIPGKSDHKAFGFGFHETKVLVCHIPPGNPANAHTISVGLSAVKAHLAHGDRLGACMESVSVTVDCGGGNDLGTGI